MCGMKLFIYSQTLMAAPLKVGMDKKLHTIRNSICNYIFMLVKLIGVSKSGLWWDFQPLWWEINNYNQPRYTASLPKSYPVCAWGFGNQTWLAGRSMTISALTLSQLTQNTRTNTHILWHQYGCTILMSYLNYISLELRHKWSNHWHNKPTYQIILTFIQ